MRMIVVSPNAIARLSAAGSGTDPAGAGATVPGPAPGSAAGPWYAARHASAVPHPTAPGWGRPAPEAMEPAVRVKVCGIRRRQDVLLAATLGADAIGLLVGQRHRSEDFLDPEQARELAEACPPLVTPVLVTHVEEADEVVALARELRVTTIQMHSECSAATLRAIRRSLPGVRLVRALHATGAEAIEQVRDLAEAAHAFIVDSVNAQEDRIGGTGLTHDWALSRRIVDASPIPVILAGGLDAGNVARAITSVRPYGVDANTRLRGAGGFKDPAKVAAFVRDAKSAFLDLAGQRSSNGEHGFGRP